MAVGDLTVFDEAKAKMIDGDWASTDNFYLAICDNTTAPTAATATGRARMCCALPQTTPSFRQWPTRGAAAFPASPEAQRGTGIPR